MSEARKLVAILVADVVGYSRLAGMNEERTLARVRALRSDLIDPTIALHDGRIVKRTGDGSIIEFRSVVDAVRCAIEVQTSMVERNAGVPPERRIEFRVGVRGERRRFDGRRRQYRCATGKHRQAGGNLSIRRRLPPGQGTARFGHQRPWQPKAEEHCRSRARLLPAGGCSCPGEIPEAVLGKKEPPDAGVARRRNPGRLRRHSRRRLPSR
jgi:hypothetical protein